MITELKFTVDSRLLEELGERLVGRSSTALAELIKNAYDADAKSVEVRLDQEGAGAISVVDDGHGMTFDEFKSFWMRVGSQHKREVRVSRDLHRPLTGSKGVGRIAAQILSRSLRIISVSSSAPRRRLLAHLDWNKAITKGDLVDVTVAVTVENLSSDQNQGTTLILEDLKQEWSPSEIKALAQEVWQLQPPFGLFGHGHAGGAEFQVTFAGPDEDLIASFNEQMQAILHLWTAKARGYIDKKRAVITLGIRGEPSKTHEFEVDDTRLNVARFEVRFYELQGRQPYGIRVQDAREYLDRFGGVHIYDSGFRLPFYGEKDNDWLLISFDTAKRVTMSQLLPRSLQVPRGMLSLPRWNQVLGVVEINTSTEPDLEVTITRDRLVETKTFRDLRDVVRRGIHWYANEKALRRLEEEIHTPAVRASDTDVSAAIRLLQSHAGKLPSEDLELILGALEEVAKTAEEQVEQAERRVALLSVFATAGISALGYQHEMSKQLFALEHLVRRIQRLQLPNGAGAEIQTTATELSEWVRRARQVGRMFSHLLQADNVEEERRFRAGSVLRQTVDQIDPIRREAKVDTSEVSDEVRLPIGTYMEWNSVFQNVFFNALNAMVDSSRREIRCKTEQEESMRRVIIEDTGRGLEPSEAEQYFEPLARGPELSAERRALGFGGTGLGLTIVRLIAQQRGARVFFREPDDSYSTAFVLEWEEV